MRIALAKLLLQKPTCFCSTSPPTTSTSNRATGSRSTWTTTNAFVLISHDRYFLDVTVNKTVEVWNKRITFTTATTKSTSCKKKSAARN